MNESISNKLCPSESNKSILDDFSRDVWCLFGFPIDNLTLESTCQTIDRIIRKNSKCVLSTVNINWLNTSLSNLNFRSTIINSDICVIDGVPLLWLAKTVGIPVTGVVPGSTLMQSLYDQTYNTLQSTIFFFGGEEGIGQKAVEKLESDLKGLKPVGQFNPGFGTVEDFNKDEIISEINGRSPDILLVALGALKGQLWIEANRDRLKAKLISHLGATINFLAGSVKRAPKWMQRIGIEWLWRIAEEPSLFYRYWGDGISILRLLSKNIFHFFSFKIQGRRYRKYSTEGVYKIETIEREDLLVLRLDRIYNVTSREIVRDAFYSAVIKKKDIILDFKQVIFIDNGFLGLFLLLVKHQKKNKKNIKLENVNKNISMILKMNLIHKTLDTLNFPLWKK